MAMGVTAPAAWKANLSAQGPDWVLTVTCPTCANPLMWMITPGPWTEAQDKAAVARLSGPDGHRDPGFAQFETDRAAGKVKTVVSRSMPFGLFCFRCNTGADATITA